MSSSPVISVRGLTKEYRIGEQKGRSALSEAIASPFRRNGARKGEWFRALDDVSFDVAPGTALGIVGRNGAGKSTLLKVLSRITKPTAGEVRLRGRVGSLLEVGTGFHPELTGRENVYMNGAILGMRKTEIDRKFDEIVAFAEVERFIDTPVKRYSSGMYVRLAFAVAAHLEPEILLIDEVLAVGDVAFQKKCLGKMGEVAGEGRTVLFVSHNTAAIQQLTTECVLLEGGAVVEHGPTASVLATYLDKAADRSSFRDLSVIPRYDHALGRTARFAWGQSAVPQGVFGADDPLVFHVGVEVEEPIPTGRISFTICRFDGTSVGTAFGSDMPTPPMGAVTYEITVSDARLAPGCYYLNLGYGRGNVVDGFFDYDVVLEALHFEVMPPRGAGDTTTTWHPNWGPIRLGAPVVRSLTAEVRSA